MCILVRRHIWKRVGKKCVAVLCVDVDMVDGCCKTTGLGLLHTKQVCCRRTALQEVQSEAQEVEKAKVYQIGTKLSYSQYRIGW